MKLKRYIKKEGIENNKRQYQDVEKGDLPSNDEYYKIFENNGIAMLILAEDYTIKSMNSECVRLFGYSKEELLGKKDWISFLNKNAWEIIQYYNDTYTFETDAISREYEMGIATKYGTIIDILMNVSNIPESLNRLVSFQNVTKFRKVENRLNIQLKLNEAIIQSLKLLRFTTDVDINEVLRILGEALSVDVCCIYQFDDSCKTMYKRNEWYKKEIYSQTDKLQILDAELFPNLINDIRTNHIYELECGKEISGESNREQEKLKNLGVNCMLAVPINNNKQEVFACMVFFVCNKDRQGIIEISSALEIFMEIIGSYLKANTSDLQ